MRERLRGELDLTKYSEEQLAERVQLLTSVIDGANAELQKIEDEYRSRLEGCDAPMEETA